MSEIERYESWLSVAVEAAHEAAEYLRGRWRNAHTIHPKGYRDIVTESDTTAERIILGRLREAFPAHAVTSEEAGADTGAAAVRWLVDPLDGTTNFSRDNPNFCVSIAAAEGDRSVVAVIVDPLRGWTFTATRGGGARLNGELLHTSGRRDVDTAMFTVDFPRDPQQRAALLSNINRLMTHVRTMRALGSAALNMAYVAAGWADFYLNVHLAPWDHAAAGLLVQEAGGAIGTCSGQPWTPYVPDPLLAATPELLSEIRRMLEHANA